MRATVWLGILVSLGMPGDVAATSIPPYRPMAKSFRQFSPNGEFVFVMKAPNELDDKLQELPESEAAPVRFLRAKYATSGMYHAHSGELLWATSEWWDLKTQIRTHEVLVANDGRYAVWLSHSPAGPRKNPPRNAPPKRSWNPFAEQPAVFTTMGSSFETDRAATALQFLAQGQPVKTYQLFELIAKPAYITDTSAFFVYWLDSCELGTEQFVLRTHDDQTLIFDARTGELISSHDQQVNLWEGIWPWIGRLALIAIGLVAIIRFVHRVTNNN